MRRLRWVLFGIVLACGGCFNGLLIKPVQTDEPMREEVVRGVKHGWTADKIAIVDVDGLIVNMDTSTLLTAGENPVAGFRERLEKAAEDPKVRAVVGQLEVVAGE